MIVAGLEPGTWTELITGALTAGALAIAVLVVWIERRDRRSDRFEATARQAREIGFWAEEEDFHVVNTGHLPVYDVAVSKGFDFDFPLWAGVLPPGGALTGVHGIDTTELQTTEVPLELFFRDNAGATWVRQLDGALNRITRPRGVVDIHAGFPRRRTPISFVRSVGAERRAKRLFKG